MITRRNPAQMGNGRRPIRASQSITSNVQNRNNRSIMAATNLTPAQRAFASQLQRNCNRSSAIMAATNTSNIMTRPEFTELLPMFVQQLIITDIAGSVAMKSRQQLIPYFKFIAENTKGETKAGTVLASPFANRQGVDPNFTGRVVKNETVEDQLMYTPVLPGTVTIKTEAGVYVDKGDGKLYDKNMAEHGTIEYGTGAITGIDGDMVATYQYDNETVGPDTNSQYGAKMGKGYLQLDELNLVAEAHELACYHSVFSAFAAQQEYGASIADMQKEAAIGEITAEINTNCLDQLAKAASYKPQFNWDASPVLSGSVVPSDYLNMFKLKLGQAAASVYQQTRMTRPNRLIVGTTAAEYMSMINGFQSAGDHADEVGPYHLGKLDAFEIYVNPSYNPDTWVMCSKSNDLRKNSCLFGEYMPVMTTDAIGLANMSVQQGYATMYAFKCTVPETIVSGKILGTF